MSENQIPLPYGNRFVYDAGVFLVALLIGVKLPFCDSLLVSLPSSFP